MKNSEARKMGLYMKWSIFVDNEAMEHVDDEKWELDLTACAPDGSYFVEAAPSVVDPATSPGVVVHNGKFDLLHTSHAVESAVRLAFNKAGWTIRLMDDFDHVYIERLMFDKGKKMFVASLGS